MRQLSLAYYSSCINYYVFGSGNKILFCLHGYGEDGNSFAFLEKYTGSSYTLYAIDFPFHGKTEWKEKKAFTITDLIEIIGLIQLDKNKQFSLLAYSMGGRAAMHLLQKISGKIDRVTLIAPDGLHNNFWYWITTQTIIGNKAFKKIMKKPGWFFSVLKGFDKLNIYNKSVIKFVHYYLDDEAQRMMLYKRWTCMRNIKADLQTIKKICAEKDIQLNFLFGKYDRIILSKRADIFKNTNCINIKILDAGHQLLREKYVHEIIALLNG